MRSFRPVRDADEMDHLMGTPDERGYSEVVAQLLAVGSVQAVDVELCVASREGCTDKVASSLRAGAHATTSGNFPLFAASRRGYHEIVSMLLAAGVDCRANHHEAFHWAVQGGHHELLSILLEDVVTLEARLSTYFLTVGARMGYLKTIPLLVSYGADIHYENDSVLYRAVTHGCTETILVLLTAGWGESVRREEELAMTKGEHCDVVERVLEMRGRRGF